MDCSMPGFPVFYYLLEFAQTHVHCVNDAIHPSHPLSLSSLALNPSQHQGANCKFLFFLLVNFSCRPLQVQLQFRPDKAMAHPERGAEAHIELSHVGPEWGAFLLPPGSVIGCGPP